VLGVVGMSLSGVMVGLGSMIRRGPVRTLRRARVAAGSAKASVWGAPPLTASVNLLVVASAIVEALSELDLAFPDVDKKKKKELNEIRDTLLAEKD